MTPLTLAIFLSVANSKIIDYVKAPIAKKWPELDLWWMAYAALLTGIGLTWLAQVNLFGEWIANETAAVLLSGVVIGGGSSLIYDIFTDKPAKITATAEPGGEIGAVGVKVTPPEGK